MRYKVLRGIEIRTENAAKPESQASRFLLDHISQLDHAPSTFDYGCGKLRYQRAIEQTTDLLTVVDSEIQLSRTQIIRKEKTSIKSLFKKSNRISVRNESQFRKTSEKFDRGFCINVLSVIPSYKMRNQVLETIRNKLGRGGECLFVVQYRNSDFSRMMQMPNAVPYLDGFLINSLRGYSFYGLISPSRFESCLRRARFQIRNIRLNDGSAYCWVTPSIGSN